MEHAIPRQITTFEFKLIGFLTLKQFIYLALFAAVGALVFFIFPIPVLNVILALLVGAAGAAFAFVPINERPLDVWVRNFIQRLSEPSQYYFHKKNTAPDFLKDVYLTPPQIITTHIEARQKLNQYLVSTNQVQVVDPQKAAIHELIARPNLPTALPIVIPITAPSDVAVPTISPIARATPIAQPVVTTPPVTTSPSAPFLFGVIKNKKELLLPNILVYIKDISGKSIRILKTNLHGVYATYHPFSSGEYTLEMKDTGNKYFFDTMKIKVNSENPSPITILSKEA